ncbi:hypothetical protein OsJ_30909 [Oryza sativa Japonica Group]|uniref:Uncharacterized protein n=2 Tax=Oryza sativa subsp. japonica TaxID=39947 RepID=A0A8J8YM90_ORYSJ|nr:hypothetical protein LOC_Os10g10570 [Oryza sativa Japonica Group]EAZ15499.1 hypothetical protein OsJ_30909 [Oryza sativa Japonica Group]
MDDDKVNAWMAKKTMSTMFLGPKGNTTTTTSTQLPIDVVVGGPLAASLNMDHELGHYGPRDRYRDPPSARRIEELGDSVEHGGCSAEIIEGSTYNNCHGSSYDRWHDLEKSTKM